MNAIGFWEYPEFERWAIENYPDEFEKWGVEAAAWLDFDEWCRHEAPFILEEWEQESLP